MRVLHVIPSLSPKLGGPTHVVLNLVKALLEQGIDAEVVTTDDDGADLLDVPLAQRTFYKNIPVWFLPRFSPRLKEFIFSPAITTWLWQHIQRYDVLDNHYLFSYAPTCAGVVARHKQIPYTVRTMGQLSPWALSQSRTKKQIYSALVERCALAQASAIHCTTRDEVADVRRFGIQTPTATIPLGVDFAKSIPSAKHQLYQRYRIPDGRFIILFLSRLHYKKRPGLLLESARQLVSHDRDIHVLLAGTGAKTYVHELSSLAHSLNLSDRVTFTGFVQGKDKDLLLQGSDTFVLPSFSENFGVAIAEALAAGLPVITTPGVQISSDIADANAGIIVAGEKVVIAQAIATLMDKINLRQILIENGRRLARQRYSWEQIAKQLITVYALILKNQRLPGDLIF